jgi:hypothetical protein
MPDDPEEEDEGEELNLEDDKNVNKQLLSAGYPITFIEEEIIDQIQDQRIFNLFDRLIGLVKQIESGAAKWKEAIEAGTRIDPEKDSLLEQIILFQKIQGKTIDALNNIKPGTEKLLNSTYINVTHALENYCSILLGNVLGKAKIELVDFLDTVMGLTSDEEEIKEEGDGSGYESGGEDEGGESGSSSSNQQKALELFVEFKKQKNVEHARKYRADLKRIKSSGNPLEWDDEKFEKYLKLLGRKGVERAARLWNVVSEMAEKKMDRFKAKYRSDPEWRKEYLEKKNVRVQKSRKKWSKATLEEVINELENLRKNGANLEEEIDKKQKEIDKRKEDKLPTVSLEKEIIELSKKLIECNGQIIELEKTKKFIEARRRRAGEVGIEYGQHATDVKRTVYWTDPLTGKKKTRTDWGEILWGSDGWKLHFQQNLNTERSDIKRAILEKLKSDKSLSEKYKKLLDEVSTTEATRSDVTKTKELYEQHTINVQSIIQKLEEKIKEDMGNLIFAKEDVQNLLKAYTNTILMGKDFRIFVNKKINEISSLHLDEFLESETGTLSEESMQKINHVISECIRYIDMFESTDPTHRKWLSSCQLRVLKQFLPRLKAVYEFALERKALEEINEPVSEETSEDEELE